MGWSRELGTVLGIREDDSLRAAIPNMSQQELIQQHQVACFRSGSAGMGVTLNSIASFFCPAFLFGTGLNLRQFVVARRTKKKLKKEMASTAHVDGTVRATVAGATLKLTTYGAFLGPGNLETQLLEYLPHGNAVATHEFQGAVHEAFLLPHAFNQNDLVRLVQALGDGPKEAVLGQGQTVQSWGQIGSWSQLGHQLAVGPAMEANAPAMLVEKATESAVEDWTRRHGLYRT